jgi:hypothetical protein
VELFEAAREREAGAFFAALERVRPVPAERTTAVVELTAAASFSRSFITERLVFCASRRSAVNILVRSRYPLFAPLPASLPSDWSALLASSSAFSKRLTARSTSLRVDADGAAAEDARLEVDRVPAEDARLAVDRVPAEDARLAVGRVPAEDARLDEPAAPTEARVDERAVDFFAGGIGFSLVW